jgi:cob(I)alamin adenosyltransferase
MGDIDELNSLIGVLVASGLPNDISGYLLNIQHRLFDIGAELAIPGNAVISPDCVKRLEDLIDSYNNELPVLKEFVLPGGSMPASLCHLARTVCRRAERTLVKLARNESFNSETLRYINRLSDLFFVFARTLNQSGKDKEVLWDSDRLKRSV